MPYAFNCLVMPVNHFPHYLKQIGWRGSFEYLITLLESLSCLADSIFSDIDIGDEISTIPFFVLYRGRVDLEILKIRIPGNFILLLRFKRMNIIIHKKHK